MHIDVATISKNITVNQANATASSKKLIANATANTFYNLQSSQADAYAGLINNLTFNGTELIDFMRIQLIKNYPNGNLIISLPADGSRART